MDDIKYYGKFSEAAKDKDALKAEEKRINDDAAKRTKVADARRAKEEALKGTDKDPWKLGLKNKATTVDVDKDKKKKKKRTKKKKGNKKKKKSATKDPSDL